MARGLLLGMRCVSTSLRNKWTTLIGKLLRRIQTSTHALLHRWTTKAPGPAGVDAADRAQELAGVYHIKRTAKAEMQAAFKED